jgi:hypothetical protein
LKPLQQSLLLEGFRTTNQLDALMEAQTPDYLTGGYYSEDVNTVNRLRAQLIATYRQSNPMHPDATEADVARRVDALLTELGNTHRDYFRSEDIGSGNIISRLVTVLRRNK